MTLQISSQRCPDPTSCAKFSYAAPHITKIRNGAGPPGTLITLTGFSFGTLGTGTTRGRLFSAPLKHAERGCSQYPSVQPVTRNPHGQRSYLHVSSGTPVSGDQRFDMSLSQSTGRRVPVRMNIATQPSNIVFYDYPPVVDSVDSPRALTQGGDTIVVRTQFLSTMCADSCGLRSPAILLDLTESPS